MIKGIIRLALVFVVGIIGYNYFYGTVEEKEQSKAIIGQVKDSGKKLFSSIGTLIKSEKQKFDDGKYEEAMTGLDKVFGNLKERAKEDGGKFREELKDLDLDQENLKEKMKEMEGKNPEEKRKLRDQFIKILDKIKDVSDQMEEK